MTDIELHRSGGVARIVLNGPQRRNALTPDSATTLVEICDAIDGDNTIGATIVQGAEGYFCSGADRQVLSTAMPDPASPQAFTDTRAIYTAIERVGRLRTPTIAAVRGGCVGAGINLMFATDLRIVALDARIIAGFLRIGVHPGGGHFLLAGRLAGREAAAALGLFGEEIDGQRSQELGMAWAAVDDSEVEPRAMEMAQRVADDPDLARAACSSLRTELGPPAIPWAAALQAEHAVQMWSFRRKAF